MDLVGDQQRPVSPNFSPLVTVSWSHGWMADCQLLGVSYICRVSVHVLAMWSICTGLILRCLIPARARHDEMIVEVCVDPTWILSAGEQESV